jgi:GNAT superfamily N-acetyltransferase
MQGIQERLAPACAQSLRKRDETASDTPFRYELFRQSRLPMEDFSFLEPAMRETLLRQQFQGQTLSYRTQFPDARFEIMEAEDRPVGRLVTHRGADAFLIVDVALLPDWRRRGIGAHILREICDAARARNLPVRLALSPFNVDALRLYSRLEFAPIGRDEIQIFMEWRAPQESAAQTQAFETPRGARDG